MGVAPAGFRAKGGGGPTSFPPVPDRAAHADGLARALDAATANFSEVVEEQKELGLPEAKRGVLVAVTSRKGIELVTGSRRPTSPGLKLYGIERGSAEGGEDKATYYVNASGLTRWRTKLEEYSAWTGPERNAEDDEGEEGVEGNPFKFFESAADFRAATYRDLWRDSLDRLPTKRGRVEWELWVRNDLTDKYVERILELGVEGTQQRTAFEEIFVQTVKATPEQIQNLVRSTGAIVELRSASQLRGEYFDAPRAKRYAAAGNLASRVESAGGRLARVTLLDTGVDHSNPMLSSAITSGRMHAVIAGWSKADDEGHGTKMAGVVQFLDLGNKVKNDGAVEHYTELESVKVTATGGAGFAPAHWAIQRAVQIVERHETTDRIFCLAQTVPDEFNDGRITATSAAIDLLSFNDGESPRLFCVAAGNVSVTPDEPYQIADYADRNARFGIESPGQAFNAITVGAYTNKAKADGGAELVAPKGDLSPTSRTAASWTGAHAGKPDIVLEGGNFEIQGGDVFAIPSRANLILTTAAGDPGAPLGLVGETSAATARASGLLGRVRWAYPNYRPETLRGLLVHSAEWSPAMRQELQRLRAGGHPRARSAQMIFSRYGWGVPNEARLYRSNENDFTLIIEDSLVPYAVSKSTARLNEMKYFRLPWPRTELVRAGQAEVELKVTLSYFVEPYPQADTLDRFSHYASTRLSFDLKQNGETDEDAQAVFNDFSSGTAQTGRTDGWELGEAAFRGSLHQDTWRGPAYLLADRDSISVAPAKGWWADINKSEHDGRAVNFSLIVSLKAPAGVDLMTETSTAMSNIRGTVVEGLVEV